MAGCRVCDVGFGGEWLLRFRPFEPRGGAVAVTLSCILENVLIGAGVCGADSSGEGGDRARGVPVRDRGSDISELARKGGCSGPVVVMGEIVAREAYRLMVAMVTDEGVERNGSSIVPDK